MSKELKLHFHPKSGWMNDPNGLIWYGGKYHAFFQHNPYATHWDTMHWGHAVSEDLLHWEERPIALWPDRPYEDDGGCFSGSAVERDGELWLFYTSVSHVWGQTQSLARSPDGVTFEKYRGNPLISAPPPEGSRDFRDPKVTWMLGKYYMVCGSGRDGVGKILLYSSPDLLRWEYRGVLLEGKEFGGVLECPDFFPLGDQFVLMFSQMGRKTHSTVFCVGDFDGEKFTPRRISTPEAGPQFYAPQSFQAPNGRRIVLGWMYDWERKPRAGEPYVGAFTIPRELTVLPDGRVRLFPIAEALPWLTDSDPQVRATEHSVEVLDAGVRLLYEGGVERVDILRDGDALEVFINGGEASFTVYQP